MKKRRLEKDGETESSQAPMEATKSRDPLKINKDDLARVLFGPQFRADSDPPFVRLFTEAILDYAQAWLRIYTELHSTSVVKEKALPLPLVQEFRKYN